MAAAAMIVRGAGPWGRWTDEGTGSLNGQPWLLRTHDSAGHDVSDLPLYCWWHYQGPDYRWTIGPTLGEWDSALFVATAGQSDLSLVSWADMDGNPVTMNWNQEA